MDLLEGRPDDDIFRAFPSQQPEQVVAQVLPPWQPLAPQASPAAVLQAERITQSAFIFSPAISLIVSRPSSSLVALIGGVNTSPGSLDPSI